MLSPVFGSTLPVLWHFSHIRCPCLFTNFPSASYRAPVLEVVLLLLLLLLGTGFVGPGAGVGVGVGVDVDDIDDVDVAVDDCALP